MNVIITGFLSLWRNLFFFLLQVVLCASDELQVQLRWCKLQGHQQLRQVLWKGCFDGNVPLIIWPGKGQLVTMQKGPVQLINELPSITAVANYGMARYCQLMSDLMVAAGD